MNKKHFLPAYVMLVMILLLAACGGGGGGGGPAADSTGPTAQSVSPLESATDVPRDSVMSITFNENVNCLTVNSTTFTVYQNLTPVNGTIGCSANTATFTPDSSLEPQKTFTVTVSGDVEDTSGNPIGTDKVWSFTTGDTGGNSIWDQMIWDHDNWG